MQKQRDPRARRLILGAAMAAAAGARVLAAQDSIPAAEKYTPVARNLTALIERERALKAIPAMSIALVDGQRIVWARGFGWADSAAKIPATASTLYRVGSVSKLVTDIAIMQLVEQHKLALDVPIRRYLPTFRPKNPFGGEITIRALASHHSGLALETPVGGRLVSDSVPTPTLSATVASLNSTTLAYKPGTKMKYSNAGVAVLGFVVERTQGEPFAPYIDRAVLRPMGMEHSSFRPRPEVLVGMAKGTMWTIDGRRFVAPNIQLGMAPSTDLYSNVIDLGKFIEVLSARGAVSGGGRVLSRASLDAMWTPQFAAPGVETGYGLGFDVRRLAGHRVVGHGGSIYGFATELLVLPDDSLGVVVTASLDVANGVTRHVADAAARMLLDLSGGDEIRDADSTSTIAPERALELIGRYVGRTMTVDLDEFEGGLFATLRTPSSRVELRVPQDASSTDLIVDDAVAYGRRIRVLDGGRLVVANDTLRRVATPNSDIVPIQTPKPPDVRPDLATVIGEYGHNASILYIREKDGRLNALIDWYLEYPLDRVTRNRYRFPSRGFYDGEEVVFERDAKGTATAVIAGGVRLKRRALPADNDRVNFKITPVRPVADLRKDALAASPPREPAPIKSPDLVELRSLDPTIKYDIRYATANNFMGTPFYSSAHAFMQRDAAEAVVRAAAELRKLGYGLLIHDSYRPWYVTKMFWDGTPPDKHMFVADPARGSRHNRGAAVDLTLYDLKSGAPIRMTGGYDEFSDRSYPLYPGGTSRQRWHRDFLRHAMEAQGFIVNDTEWWHFDYKDWRSYPIGNLTFEQLASGHR
jgi:CubicO group peptidase (beta-lactamase class C family)/D-alanyl-D-alanine dipeptidase